MNDITRLAELGDGPEDAAERGRLVKRLYDRYAPRMEKLSEAAQNRAHPLHAVYAQERAALLLAICKSKAVVANPMLQLVPAQAINALCAACFAIGYLEASDPAPDDAPVDDDSQEQPMPQADDAALGRLQKLWDTPAREPRRRKARGG